MEGQQIPMNVVDEREIFADQITVMHNPIKFFVDFANTTPRVDLGNNRFVLKHNVVILDPFLAKDFLRVLEENLKKYEEKFGPIKKPETIAKAEKEAKKSHLRIEATTSSGKIPYVG